MIYNIKQHAFLSNQITIIFTIYLSSICNCYKTACIGKHLKERKKLTSQYHVGVK